MKRPGEPPAGYLNFSIAALINQHQMSRQDLSEADPIG